MRPLPTEVLVPLELLDRGASIFGAAASAAKEIALVVGPALGILRDAGRHPHPPPPVIVVDHVAMQTIDRGRDVALVAQGLGSGSAASEWARWAAAVTLMPTRRRHLGALVRSLPRGLPESATPVVIDADAVAAIVSLTSGHPEACFYRTTGALLLAGLSAHAQPGRPEWTRAWQAAAQLVAGHRTGALLPGGPAATGVEDGIDFAFLNDPILEHL